MANFGDKLSKGLSIAKQWTKQKMGKAESSSEPPEFLEMLDKLKLSQNDLKEFLKHSKSLYKSSKSMMDDHAMFHTSLNKIGAEQKDVSDQVRNLVNIETSRVTHTRKLNDALFQLFVQPIEQLLDHELEEAIELKKKYELAHLEYDARVDAAEMARDKPADKRELAEKELKQATETYQDVKLKLTEKCQDVQRKVVAIFSVNLQKYHAAQEEFNKNVHEGTVDVQF